MRTSRLDKHVVLRTTVLLFGLCVRHVLSAAPDQMSQPVVDSIGETSFGVSYPALTGAAKYFVTVKPRYSSESRIIDAGNSTNLTVPNLSGSVLYDVSVKAQNSIGETGLDSDVESVQTHPEAPTITLKNFLPHSVFVFFRAKNYARISEWTLEYSESGSTDVTTVKTAAGQYFGYWLTGLIPDTMYSLRGGASQVSGTTNLTEVSFSSWQDFTTGSLSVFGRVTLNNSNEEDALRSITSAYADASIDHNGISIVENSNDVFHYEIKVKDKSLPSSRNYILSEPQFTDPAINNGDESVGRTLWNEITADRLQLQYSSSTSPSLGVAKKYMIIVPEDSEKFELLLNHANSETNEFVDHDSILISYGTEIATDGGVENETLTMNTAVGFIPKFLVKDFLNQTGELLYAVYYDAIYDGTTRDHVFLTTELFSVDITTSTYSSSSTGTEVTINIPAVDKAIKYEILQSDAPVATVEEADIDGSERIQALVSSLENGTSYQFQLRVTTRTQNGLSQIKASDTTLSVTANSNQCSSCPSGRCETNSIGTVICLLGTTTPSVATTRPSESTTQEAATTQTTPLPLTTESTALSTTQESTTLKTTASSTTTESTAPSTPQESTTLKTTVSSTTTESTAPSTPQESTTTESTVPSTPGEPTEPTSMPLTTISTTQSTTQRPTTKETASLSTTTESTAPSTAEKITISGPTTLKTTAESTTLPTTQTLTTSEITPLTSTRSSVEEPITTQTMPLRTTGESSPTTATESTTLSTSQEPMTSRSTPLTTTEKSTSLSSTKESTPTQTIPLSTTAESTTLSTTQVPTTSAAQIVCSAPRVEVQISDPTDRSFAVTWTNVGTGVNYVVRISCTGGCSEGDTSLGTSDVEAPITGLTAGQEYEICVETESCVSKLSTCVTYTIVPPQVTGVEMIVGHISVTLTWNSAKGATYYVVKVIIATGARARLIEKTRKVEEPQTSVTLRNLAPEQSYTLEIRSGNSAGESSPYHTTFTTDPTPTTTTPDMTTFITEEIETTRIYTIHTTTTAVSTNDSVISTTPEATTEADITTTAEPTTPTADTTIPTTPEATSVADPTTTTPTLQESSTVVSSTTETASTIRLSVAGGSAPWWFIFCMVIAGIIIIATIAALVWYFRRSKLYLISSRTAV